MSSFLNKLKALGAKLKPALAKVSEFLSPVTRFIKKHNEILNPIFVLTAICLIIAMALSVTNSLTSARISAMNLETKNREMAALLHADSYTEQTVAGYEADRNFSFYSAITGSEVGGYIVTTSAKGYGGDIVVMTAFNTDKSVKSISILSADDETPGLGQNVNKESFYSQFAGLIGNATVVKNQADSSKGEIKAWTGATISSKAVTSAVNNARAALETYLAAPAQTETITIYDQSYAPEATEGEPTQGGAVIENQ